MYVDLLWPLINACVKIHESNVSVSKAKDTVNKGLFEEWYWGESQVPGDASIHGGTHNLKREDQELIPEAERQRKAVGTALI